MIDKAPAPSLSVTVYLSAPGGQARVSPVGQGVLVGPDLVLVPQSALVAQRRRPDAPVLVCIRAGRGQADPSTEWHAVTAVEPLTFDGDPDGARAAALLHLSTASSHRPTVSRGRAGALERAWAAGEEVWEALVASGALPSAAAAPADVAVSAPAHMSQTAAPVVLTTLRLSTAAAAKPAWWCRAFPWLC